MLSRFKPLGQAKTKKDEPDRYESFNLGQDGLMGNATLQKLPPTAYSLLSPSIDYLLPEALLIYHRHPEFVPCYAAEPTSRYFHVFAITYKAVWHRHSILKSTCESRIN